MKTNSDFLPGFRLNIFDCLLLTVGIIFLIIAFLQKSLPAIIASYVIFTFFLYCNVFRIRRKPELIWAFVFLISSISSFYFGNPSWLMTFCLNVFLTIILIIYEMQHPSYHGIFWQKINPNLIDWWNKNNGM